MIEILKDWFLFQQLVYQPWAYADLQYTPVVANVLLQFELV